MIRNKISYNLTDTDHNKGEINMKVNIKIGRTTRETKTAGKLGEDIKTLVDDVLENEYDGRITCARDLFKADTKTLLDIADNTNVLSEEEQVEEDLKNLDLSEYENIDCIDILKNIENGEYDVIGFSTKANYAITRPNLTAQGVKDCLHGLNEELEYVPREHIVAKMVEDIQEKTTEKFNKVNTILNVVNWIETDEMQGISADFPVYTTEGVEAPAEGETSKPILNTAVTLNISEYVAGTLISDLSLLNTPREEIIDTISSMFSNQTLGRLESDVTSLFNDFSKVEKISGQNNMSLDLWFNAIAHLLDRGVHRENIVAVLSPHNLYGPDGLRARLPEGSFAAPTEEDIKNGFVGSVAGVPILTSASFVDDGTPAVMFDKTRAIGLATKGFNLIGHERNESKRGEELVNVSRWKAGMLIEELGIQL